MLEKKERILIMENNVNTNLLFSKSLIPTIDTITHSYLLVNLYDNELLIITSKCINEKIIYNWKHIDIYLSNNESFKLAHDQVVKQLKIGEIVKLTEVEILNLIDYCGEVFKYINNPSDKQCEVALHSNIKNANYIDNLTDEMQKIIIGSHGCLYLTIDRFSEENKKYAIDCDPMNYVYIFDPSYELVEFAISKSPYLILVTNYHDEHLWEVALSKRGDLIKYCKDPSEKLQLAAIRENPWEIRHIKNPTLKVQLEAISEDITIIQCIVNPHEDLLNFLKNNL